MDSKSGGMFFYTRKAAITIGLFSFALLVLSNNSPPIILHPSAASGAQQYKNSDDLGITHGVASGDVTNDSAVIWSRANGEAEMHVEYDTDANFSHPTSVQSLLPANQTTDYTGYVKLKDLSPDALYYYRVWFVSTHGNKTESQISDTLTGSFRTSPNTSESESERVRPISFVFAADLGGQKHCRQVDKGGYSIFEKMQEKLPDFFIANGDMIYAADQCPVEGPTSNWHNIRGNFSGIADPDINWTNIDQVRDVYIKHWQYNRADPYLQSFLQNTSMYSQWDDHEVINDFGALWPYWNSIKEDREGYHNIVKEGRDAFFNYSPIDRNHDDINRIYRSFSWGPNLDLIILDARSYRSPNNLADTVENNKTMLGNEQLKWLEQSLSNSSATWKVISSDVPISVPTGANASILGRDGWASGNDTASFSYKTGFEREFHGLLKYLDDNNVKNIVFVTTDVHFPANIRYEVDANNDGDKLVFHEIISGPLSAFRFGTPGGVPIPQLDTTFEPQILYEEGGIFNFGYVRIQSMGEDDDDVNDGIDKVHLVSDIIGEDGVPRSNSHLDIAPQ
ncbi:MAG: alkaline phosphatase D family protein [Nitrososphaeraceae archaeon]